MLNTLHTCHLKNYIEINYRKIHVRPETCWVAMVLNNWVPLAPFSATNSDTVSSLHLRRANKDLRGLSRPRKVLKRKDRFSKSLFSLFFQIFFCPLIWETAKGGGKTYCACLGGGGGDVLQSAPSKTSFPGLRKWLLVWSVPVSSKANDKAWTNRVGTQINSPPVFFFVIFFVIFTGIRCGTDFFWNSHVLLGESRGYCTKTKQEWPDSGSTLEICFVIFTKLILAGCFFVLQKFGVDGKLC